MSTRRALVVDAICDPPLGATERVVATVAAELVVRGLGLVALGEPRVRLAIAARDAARTSLEQAVRALGAQVELDDSAAAFRDARRVRPSELLEAAWVERDVRRHVITVAGAVQTPRVIACEPTRTVGELVDAVGASSLVWVALFGGVVIERDATLAALLRDHLLAPRLLLVLPPGHALARRARTPLAAWLRRAKSACASCGICASACVVGLPVPDLLRGLAAGGRVRVGATKLASATACTGCGACDLVCPQGISPMRVVDDLGQRLRRGGVRPPALRPRVTAVLDPALAIARQGLRRYERAPAIEIVSV